MAELEQEAGEFTALILFLLVMAGPMDGIYLVSDRPLMISYKEIITSEKYTTPHQTT
jgi:ABC-type microcin C transport system permease subunit YejE